MWDYLGVEVPDDARGVLQDMHWAVGAIGYFSTYALGNLISAQLWEKVTAEMPGLHDQFEQGEFGALARLAARAPAPPRAQVHAARAARADRSAGAIDPGAVRALSAQQVGDIYGLAASDSRLAHRPTRGLESDHGEFRVGINGFGRIGRNFFRAPLERDGDFEIVACERPRRRDDDGAPAQVRLEPRPVPGRRRARRRRHPAPAARR